MPRSVKVCILVHIVLTLIGLAAHIDQHPPGQSLFFWWPVLLGVISLLIVTVLYIFPATVAWGFLFTTMAVGLGTIGMAYFTMLTFEEPYSFWRVATDSTLPKILLLWLKLPTAWVIFSKMKPLRKEEAARGCLT